MNKKIVIAISAFGLLVALFLGMSSAKKQPAATGSGAAYPGFQQNSTQPAAAAKTTRPADAMLAPDFSMESLSATPLKLADYKGKVIILDFWATWCPPCKAEIPFFIELYTQYKDSGLVVIGAALDEYNNVKDFSEEYKINYPVGVATQEMAMKYGGVRGIPTTFVIDKEGYVVRKYVGFRPKEVFEQDFQSLK